MKKLVTSAVLAAATLGSVPVMAEVSSNMAISNMYLFRGVNLNPDGAAVSGGVDYNHDSGAYVGTWTSNADGGYELDLYAGYAGQAGDIGYDIAYFTYNYPATAGNTSLSDNNATEVMLSVSVADFSASYYVNTDSANDYTYLSLDYAMGKVGFHVGATTDGGLDSDVTADDYTDASVS
ncbi:MAG: TorF family putative porin, partial [Gammaproteobacteria bacterium]|nr:TorF family putative porin [Gammaproteobacteria bacterium]